jgi:hypothetical protein
MIPSIVKDYLSRKWMAFVIVEGLSFWGLTIGKISGTEWVAISGICIGLFTGSNVFQKKIESDSGKQNPGDEKFGVL